MSATALSALEPHPAWREIVATVEPFLDRVALKLADQVHTFEAGIGVYAEYALTNQGKQLRPALVALSGGADGEFSDDLATVAVIIEMVHLATLVHDDVMDAADMRRGRPSLAAQWGNEIAVLLGDCLFAHAVQMAAEFPTTDICRAVAATTNKVCSGEILQNQHRGDFELTRAQYFRILELKTGALFSLSCDLGAAIGTGKERQRAALRHYGMALGTAYQLYDDCLDLFGSETAVGKSLGTDLTNGILTLPVLVTMERAAQTDQAVLKKILGHWDRSCWGLLQELLDKYEAMSASREIVHQYLKTAQGHLAGLAKDQNHTALINLTEFVAQLTDNLGVVS